MFMQYWEERYNPDKDKFPKAPHIGMTLWTPNGLLGPGNIGRNWEHNRKFF